MKRSLLYFQEHFLTVHLLHLTVNTIKLRQWLKQSKKNINRNKPKQHQNNQVQPVNKTIDKQIKPVLSHRPAASRTLLLGSSIYLGINRKGLNIECHSIPGTTVDILIDKIQMFDLKCFSDIVIDVAVNECANASSDSDYELIKEKYDQLLNYINEKSRK